LSGQLRWLVLVVVWVGAAFGIVMEWLRSRMPRGYVTTAYIVVGWSALVALPWLWQSLGAVAFFGILLGGVLYTVGAVIYAARRPDPVPDVFGYHEVFHAFVLAAAFAHYCVIAFSILPRAG
jgi:hemolysin III